ncbi:glycoside hydrolase family 9 protein [uncultured Ruminococcus sp.]|uniref:glycoside hydrolase family 9 protein n=1 Tax=uncultured Ruminococcus sp. TaxID=165186 RepID=UPI002633404D|nr:glycoside hydrolase family 9 protein [uncultured Ruminococcus sp.]
MKYYLKKALAILTSCMVLSAAVTALPITADAASNMISNSTFDSGTSGWGIYKESGGKASLSTDSGRLALNISSVGTLNYAVQMYYDIVPLYQNGVYRLSYEISSTTDRFVECMIQQNGGTYQAYTWKGLDLTAEPQTVDYTFTMKADTDIMAKLVFNCGDQGEELPEHTIYLDNVVLELVDDSNVDYSEILPYEPDIVVNQVGYKPASEKVAVFRDVTTETAFSVVNADTEEIVYTGELYGETQNASAGETDFFGDFSAVTEPGSYYITCGGLDDSYAFEIGENVYGALLDDSVRMLYLQRCGTEIVDDNFGHTACHTSMATVYGTNETIDVSGGWHDAGDYGRYIVPAAKSIADLLYAYEANPELYSDAIGIPESGNGVPDILDETRYELEWMLKMQAESGGVYHKVSCANFPGYVMPEKETAELIVTPVTTTATADFCASMALAYEFYKEIDSDFAQTCRTAAEKAWAFLDANPNLIFKNPEDITTGDYGDTSDRDERYWAAAQMYRATGEQTYLTALENMAVQTGLDWSTVGDYGNLAILTMKGVDTTSTVYTKAKASVLSQADQLARATINSPYSVAVSRFNWGSNMTVANAGIILGAAYQLTGDDSYYTAAESNLNYLLGKNPNGVCYVTGYGTVSPQNPHHRPSMAKKQAMKGMLVGGVNSNLEDSAAKAYLINMPSAKCYVDHSESYSTNEITIYWNSPLTYLLSLTDTAEPEDIRGDVNDDDTCSAADLVMMQKFLLTQGGLTNWKNGDMNTDNCINGFDLSILRQFLLES